MIKLFHHLYPLVISLASRVITAWRTKQLYTKNALDIRGVLARLIVLMASARLCRKTEENKTHGNNAVSFAFHDGNLTSTFSASNLSHASCTSAVACKVCPGGCYVIFAAASLRNSSYTTGSNSSAAFELPC